MSDTDTKLPKPLPAMPTEAEIAAWSALTREEQLAALRAELDHPDCDRQSVATLEDIRREGQTAAVRQRQGHG